MQILYVIWFERFTKNIIKLNKVKCIYSNMRILSGYDEFLPVRKRRIALIIDDNFVCGRLKSIIIFRISGNIYLTE